MAKKTEVKMENGYTETREEIVAKAAKKAEDKKEVLVISPPKIEVMEIKIIGTVPLVQNRFGSKAMQMMIAAQEAGSQGKKGKKRDPKDFEECYQQARHISREGWDGVAASGFRNACVDACRLCGFKMTHCKLGIFFLADGFDRVDGTPIIKITKGEPHPFDYPVRNASGVADIRRRPMWNEGWEMILRVQYDADMFSKLDVCNLLARVGLQCGVGEGRPNSKSSCGQGWGLFRLAEE